MRFSKREEVWKKTANGGMMVGTVISPEFIHPQDGKPWVVLSIRGCVALSDVDSLRPMKELYCGEESDRQHSGDRSMACNTIEAA